jgi:DNA repair protein RecO (recombination protein O)
MEWQDDGIVLMARPHGENDAILSLLTRGHGRAAGLLRGGQGRRWRGLVQPGNRVRVRWRARLAEHLGSYTCELDRAEAGALLDEPSRLAALTAACALVEVALPERAPHPRLFDAFRRLLDALPGDDWAAHYVRWEIELLAELGFGLDLTCCATTGRTDELAFVSPRTGRAVSTDGAGIWRDRLLALPAFLVEPGGTPPAADVLAGLELAGHFLLREAFEPIGQPLPPARTRLIDRLRQSSTTSSIRRP